MGGLIGIMVEEEEDIAKVDVSALTSDAPAAAPKKEAAPEKKADEPVVSATSAAAPGTDDFQKQLHDMVHSGKFKVSPASEWWMRTHKILPTEVTATGPKGYILKYDVIQAI